MSTVRVEKTEKYSIIANQPINDKSLSWGARGLLAYLLSKPNDWQVRMTDLENQSPAGSHATRTLVRELVKAGYMVRELYQTKGGKFAWMVTVYEIPQAQEVKEEATIPQLSIDGQSIDGQLPDIVTTDLLNTELKLASNDAPPIEERKPDMLDGLLFYARSNAGKADLSFLSENLRPLGRAFVEVFENLKPLKQDHSLWRKVLREWYERGFTETEVSRAAHLHRDAELYTKSPASITYALLNLKAESDGRKTTQTENGMYL